MGSFKNLMSVPDYMKSKGTAIASIKKTIGEIGDISVGTDVEVLWMQKYEILDGTRNFNFFRADTLFPKSGLFGTDGRSLQGEWRITSADDVRVFVQNVEEMITFCKTYVAVKQQGDPSLMSIYPYGMGVYSIISDRGLNVPESIGLHIHFGGAFGAESGIRHAVAAMDALLTPVIKLFEPELGAHIRTGCGYYGDLSDYKMKPYGFEYRTLPSCIDNKDVFIGAFALAKAIAFEVRGSEGITTADLEYFKLPKAKQHDKGFLRIQAKKAHMFISRKCRFYHVYKDEIDKMFELAYEKNPEKIFCTHEDIFSTWDIACNFEDESLLKAFRKDRILLPCGNIPGYTGEESATLRPSSQRNEMKTFTVGEGPW